MLCHQLETERFTMTQRRWTGLATMGLAIAFNIPYAVLATIFDYPDILRHSAAVVLTRFAEGGSQLVLGWYGFMLTALALIPIGTTLAITPQRLKRSPALAIGAAITAALSGVTQAIGLARWVFVVPDLARNHSQAANQPEARLAAEHAFEVLNRYGGIAIGEQIGQWLLTMFVIQVAAMQWDEGDHTAALIGFGTAALIAIGTGEGLAIALGASGALFSTATITGFLLLTGWLIATALTLWRAPHRA
ncbi:MAG: hypothetical protein B7Y98_04455 [Sphingomonas sp. 32-62-10]|nr:MAG: hypothetical protein B7Z43_05420 [Sphingomonas sp. 12-62-6]OYX39636.1 MAG: hypothetical protein B7Y98_04455 [Sphingomonas sp. 32-62-10]